MDTVEEASQVDSSNENDTENEIEEKFKEFIIAYVEEFEKKLDEYAKEADIGGTAKTGKVNNTLGVPLSTAASVGAGLIGGVGGMIGRAIGGKAIENGWKYLSGRNHRIKAKNVTQIFQKIKSDELRKLFVGAASLIFFSFETQFTLITDAEGNWKRGLKKLAIDARNRTISYIHKEKNILVNDVLTRDLLTKALILGKSKDSLISFITPTEMQQFVPGTKPGHTLKNQTNLSKWKTSDIYEKSGIKILGKNGLKKYYKKKCGSHLVLGYRWSFNWERDRSWVLEYEEDYQGKLHDNPTFLKLEELEGKIELILGDINKQDSKLQWKRIENGVDGTTEKLETLKASQSEIIEVVAKQDDIKAMKEHLNEIQATILSRLPKGEKRKIFNVKEPVKTFTGRDRQLAALHNALQTQRNQVVVSQCASISGLGGIGKSELARKYACTYHATYNSNVVWIDSETQLSTKNSFHRLAEKLQISTTQKSFDSEKLVERDLLLIVEDIYEYFSDSKSLFIFDNANEFEEITNLLPSNLSPTVRKPAIIITSRNSDWDMGEEGDVDVIMLEEFTPEEALSFFKKVLEIEDGDKSNDELISQLTQKLCYFPLALRQAASYIKANDSSSATIEKYLAELCDEQNKRDLLQFKARRDRYTETTYTTWQITFRNIEKDEANGPLSILLVEIMSYLAADEISLHKTFIRLAENEERLKKAVDVLLKYSIITVEENTANIHRLVQQIIRLWLQDREREEEVLRTALAQIQKNVNDCHIAALWSYACKYTTLIDDYFFEGFEQTTSSEVYIYPLNYLVKEGNVRSIKKILDHLEGKNDLWQKLISKIKDGNSVKCTHNDAGMENVGHDTHIKSLYIYHAEVYNALRHSNSKELEQFLNNFDKSLINSWFDGHTALYKSAESGNLNVMKILIENGADINFLSRYKDTPLHVALDSKRLKVAEYLLDHGADLKIANIAGRKAIHYAADSGYLNIVQRLATTKEECESRTGLDYRPLHCAAKNDHVEIVEFLINYGVDLKTVTNKGQTVCHIAAERGSIGVVKYLIDRNFVDVNLRDRKNDPIINTAVSYGQFDIVKYLLSDKTHDKADINAFNVWGATPLFQAVLNYHNEIAKFLIEHGALIENVQNKNTLIGQFNISALHLAAALDCLEIVTILIEQSKADINMGLDTSFSPLQVAKFFGSTQICEFLIKNGADTSEKPNIENIIRIFRSFFKDTKKTGSIDYISYVYRPERLYRKFDNLVEFRTSEKMKNFVDRLQVAYSNLMQLLDEVPSKWPQFQSSST